MLMKEFKRKRFLDSINGMTCSLLNYDWKRGAEEYVENLSESGKKWLLTKPFSPDQHSVFFYEMYQILNLLEALQLQQGARVLEVGSGSGWVTELLAKLGFAVDSVEPSEEMNTLSQHRFSLIPNFFTLTKPKWFCSTLEEFDGDSEIYDAVIFHESLHHIIDKKKAMQNVYRMLKLGGKIAVDEFAWVDGDLILEEKLLNEMTTHQTMENPFDRKYLTELLQESGFSEVTRYHMINGFFDEEMGNISVCTLAQAPSYITNNLIALKGQNIKTTKSFECLVDVDLCVKDVFYEAANRKLEIFLTIKNKGEAHLLKGSSGRPGEVFIALYTGCRGGTDFIEASHRNALPVTLESKTEHSFGLCYWLPGGTKNREWFIDLVAEHRFWFSDKGSSPVRVDF